MTIPTVLPKVGSHILVRKANFQSLGPKHPAVVTSVSEDGSVVAVHAFPHLAASYYQAGFNYSEDQVPDRSLGSVWCWPEA